MQRLIAVTALVMGIAAMGCKQSDAGDAGIRACQDSCVHRERWEKAVRQDIESAEGEVAVIEKLTITEDDLADRRLVERALQMCDAIRINLAHARGLASALSDVTERSEGERKYPQLSAQSDPLAKAADFTCREEVPSTKPLWEQLFRIKNGVVGPVHELKGLYPAGPAGGCAAACKPPAK